MDILRVVLYIIAPWSPLLFKNKLYSFKLWKVALASTIGLFPFVIPLMLSYSFAIPRVLSIVFIIFSASFATLLWLFTNTRWFVIFIVVSNLLTALVFWSINWQRDPYTGERPNKSIIIKIPEGNNYYSDIVKRGGILGGGSYEARKKYFGGVLVKIYPLRRNLNDDNNDCIYEGYDYDRDKSFYWDKCKNIISE
jgi:hypothetical protein